ncbi:MAG: PKD domain-containing protein [Deltaproteobacteria bacterium]|nr:PKD domain-containing protein [Deltaproteobacteria bacterium]
MSRRLPAAPLALALLLGLATAQACDGGGGSAAPPDAAPDLAADATAPDAETPDAASDPGPELPAPALMARASAPAYAVTDETVTLDGSASEGAALYLWDFGDGRGWEAPRPDPTATVAYPAPGRYKAVLTAIDAAGVRRTAQVSVAVTWPLVFTPLQSGTIAWLPGTERAAVVSTDASELTLVARDGDTFSVTGRMQAPGGPRTLTPWQDRLLVPCPDADVLRVLDPAQPDSALALPLPRASRPYAAVPVGDRLAVSLQATGQLALFSAEATPALQLLVDDLPDARGVAALPDGRVAVTRWRSPDDAAELAFVDPHTGAITRLTLALDTQLADDTEIGGVPSYLDQLLVSPTGREAAIPSLQANVLDGVYRNGHPLTFETTVRAVVSWLDLPGGAEQFDRRKQFDNRGLASAAAWSAHGDYLYVATRGSRAVERLDALTGVQSGSLLFVGYAPEGLALSPDDRHLLVDASLSREVVVYDVTSFTALPQPLARLATVSAEPLSEPLLRGKRLFNDSLDARLCKDGYIACAHCHMDGEADGRTWDFSDRGEGLRNTITLLGHAGTGDGAIHWSANFDEIQDFEHDIRGPFGGKGLMADADFHSGTRDTTLGDSKAGISEDLDALAAYVTSFDTERPSPYRQDDGALSPAAEAGRLLFESAELGCTECHTGPRLTDSGFLAPASPLLHDVGTLGPGSGQRLGGPLEGLDTPTLRGLWRTAPYLHDGSAATLREVLTDKNPADQHGTTSGLDDWELDQLEAWLLSL